MIETASINPTAAMVSMVIKAMSPIIIYGQHLREIKTKIPMITAPAIHAAMMIPILSNYFWVIDLRKVTESLSSRVVKPLFTMELMEKDE